MIQTIHQTNNSAYITIGDYCFELFLDTDDDIVFVAVSHGSGRTVVTNSISYEGPSLGAVFATQREP